MALYNRAELYAQKGDLAAAIDDYSRAILVRPDLDMLFERRGRANLRRKDYASALKDESEAIRVQPSKGIRYLYRAMAYGAIGDAGHAQADAATAVRLEPALTRYIMVREGRASISVPHSSPVHLTTH